MKSSISSNAPVCAALFILLSMPTPCRAADEPKTPLPKYPNLRVVDYGADMGTGRYRGGPARLFSAPKGTAAVDSDGDGDTADDSVSGWEFSLSEPLFPLDEYFNNEATNAIFYGGVIGHHSNNPLATMAEGTFNENHDLRDDCNMMSLQRADSRKAGNFVQAWGLWFWKKEDFLHDGDRHAVTFDNESRLAVHVSRYWNDIDGGRWVVGEDGEFYISEKTFGTARDIEKRGAHLRVTWMLSPATTRWAIYQPEEPYHLRFDAESADFVEREFTDVSEVGFYLYKDSLSEAVIAVKWNAFECYARVGSPEQPSAVLEMDEADDELYLSSAPVSYADWKKVYQWAVSNQYCQGFDQTGYTFRSDGDMGAMTAGSTATDPVTDISFYDAVAWCNALSEYEGRTPCYYTDTGLTKVLRQSCDRNSIDKRDWRPEVHFRAGANGFRLPTKQEMANREDTGLFIAQGGAPNSQLREDVFWKPVPATAVPVATPGLFDTDDFVMIKDGQFQRADEAEVTVSDFYMQKTEVTYTQWAAVTNWAKSRGYQFDHDGDMGSMDWRTGDFKHSPAEPVTGISWFDARLFCNALSELQGRRPCYYLDEDKTKVYKESLPWRIRMVGEDHREMQTDLALFTDLGADGFRLPTWAEWSVAWRAGDTSLHLARAPAALLDRDREGDWLKHNSGGRTHPAGSGRANALGIFDLGGNVSEWLQDTPVNDYYRSADPRGDEKDGLFGIAVAGAHFNSSARGVGRRPHLNKKSAAWPWLGMRVVRCDAGAHSDKPFVPKTVLDITEADFDPLEGRTFRGNSRRTGYFGEKGLASLRGVKWKLDTGGPVHSSPVIVDGCVYIGGGDGCFYAIDAATGELKWKRDTGGEITGSATVTRDGKVLIGSAGGTFFALDAATGEPLWKFQRDPKNPEHHPVTTSPAAAHGVVFFGIGQSWNRYLTGLDLNTGREVWRLRGPKPNGDMLAPAIDGARMYLPANDNQLLEIDLRTELVTRTGRGHHCQASVPVDGGVVYYNNGYSCMLYAQADLKTMHHRTTAGDAGGGLSFFPQSGPAVHGGVSYFAKGDRRIYAIEYRDGKAGGLWSVQTAALVRSSVAVAGKHLYFGSDDGCVYALLRADGETVWKFETGGPVVSSPALSDGVLFIGSEDGFVYALH